MVVLDTLCRVDNSGVNGAWIAIRRRHLFAFFQQPLHSPADFTCGLLIQHLKDAIQACNLLSSYLSVLL
jgi:hypothetical protein